MPVKRLSEPTEEQAVDPRRTVTLRDFLGNEAVRDFLLRAWDRRQLPRAILIAGPPGIGKSTLAYGLMREIAADGGDPQSDPHALKVERGVHPDVIELTGGSSASSMILVNDIRAMEDRAATAPSEAPLKMVLIEPADRMNINSANALLKLLEEPPPRLVFLLLTAEPGKLLPTIRSRCSVLKLEPVPLEALTRWLLEQHGVQETQARLAAMLSEGRPGHALRLCQTAMLRRRIQLLEAIDLLRIEGFAILFQAADRFLDAGDLEEALMMATSLLRDALVLKTRGEGVLNLDLLDPLRRLADAVGDEGLLEAARRFEGAIGEAAYFYTPQAKAHFVEVLLSGVGRVLRS